MSASIEHGIEIGGDMTHFLLYDESVGIILLAFKYISSCRSMSRNLILLNGNWISCFVSSQPNFSSEPSTEYLDEAILGLNVDFHWRRASAIEMSRLKCFSDQAFLHFTKQLF